MIDPEYDSKIKQMNVRKNSNMIDIDSTEAQIAAGILEKGGSAEPMELFKAFMGREPQIDALLRHSGIAA